MTETITSLSTPTVESPVATVTVADMVAATYTPPAPGAIAYTSPITNKCVKFRNGKPGRPSPNAVCTDCGVTNATHYRQITPSERKAATESVTGNVAAPVAEAAPAVVAADANVAPVVVNVEQPVTTVAPTADDVAPAPGQCAKFKSAAPGRPARDAKCVHCGVENQSHFHGAKAAPRPRKSQTEQVAPAPVSEPPAPVVAVEVAPRAEAVTAVIESPPVAEPVVVQTIAIQSETIIVQQSAEERAASMSKLIAMFPVNATTNDW